MALYTLNGRPILSGEIVLPAYGAWHAEFVVDSKTALSGSQVLQTPGLTLVGTVDPARSGVYQDGARVTLRPGAGALWGEVGPKFYRNVPVSVPLADLLGSVGERVSTTADVAPLARVLPSWTRPAGTVANALDALVEAQAGSRWRALEDGTIWVGEHAWTATTFAHQVLDDHRVDGRLTIASEVPKLRPGVTFRERRIQEVRYVVTAQSVRCVARYVDGFLDAFNRAARRAADDGSDSRWYAGTVVRQLSDGTLDIKPDDIDRAPASGWTAVPLLGLPGVAVRVSAGARVRVFFDGSDRSRPRAALSEEDDSTLVSISVAGGTAGVARVGDEVDLGTITGSNAGGAVSFIWTPPGGGTPVTSPTLNVTAVISTGALKFRA